MFTLLFDVPEMLNNLIRTKIVSLKQVESVMEITNSSVFNTA